MSKYRREDPVSIAKHKHCLVCGTPIEINKEFCSDKCRVMNRKSVRSRTRNLVVITAALLVFLVLFALLRQ